MRVGWKDSLRGQVDASLTAELNREYILSKSLLRDHDGFKERSWNNYNDLNIQSDLMKHNSSDMFDKVLTGQDGSTLLLDAREVLNRFGEPNLRHVHSLLLRSAYESYGCSGEPIFNACHPKERETQGVDCADYIFYSTHGLVAHKVLSFPTIPMIRRGETPEETLTVSDICHLEPFPSLSTNFDKLVQKAYDKIQYQGEGKTFSGSTRVQNFTKSEIHQMKRVLRDLLNKSHGPKQSEHLPQNATVSAKKLSGEEIKQVQVSPDCCFWGGRWTPFPIPNKLKSNSFLPNGAFPSTHFAIGVDIVIDENTLSTCLKHQSSK
jgi:hypothetical protein